MSKTRIVLSVGIVLMFVAMFSFYFLVPRHASYSQRTGSYQIDQSFDRVRKIMIRGDCLREMVEYQHGELISHDWSNLTISAERLIQGWDVDGTGFFTVRVNDPDAGQMILDFRQDIHIDQSWMESRTTLVRPVGHLKEYTIVMRMEGRGSVTEVVNTVSLVYERKLPLSHVEYMNQKVDDSAQTSLIKGQEAMLKIVDRYKGKRFIIPIRR